MLVADTTFVDLIWSMLVFFAFIIWFWLLITVFADIFRRHDTSGFTKVLWIIFVIVAPYLGVLIYLLVNNDGMTERNVKQMKAQQAATDEYIRSTAASGPSAEIAKAKELRDSGAITDAEYEELKRKALA